MVQIIDREKMMGSGIKSPIDGKVYTRRSEYEAHVKAHDCVIVGNDNASKRREREDRIREQEARNNNR